MDHNIETTRDEDFDNNLKRAKCSESTTFSTSSMVSECPDSESENQMNYDPVSLTPSPSKSALSPDSQLMNEDTTSADDDKQVFSEESDKLSDVPNSEDGDKLLDGPISQDDDKLPNEPKHIINSLTYDYLPLGKCIISVCVFI